MSTSEPVKPTQEEIAEADKQAREFLDKIAQVPVEQQKPLTSEKFSDPIATAPELQQHEQISTDEKNASAGHE